ncbi:MAG TPA: DUF6580 family putative transport protein [Pyrinomonadaceae bacterium]|jgi:hypothetical protein
MSRVRFVAITSVILVSAAARIIPHPPNFTPITAIALFGGAYFSKKWVAFAVPLTSLFISDLVLGYRPPYVVYASFALIVCIGLLLRRRRTTTAIAAAALASSVLFFLVTNFGVWFFSGMYPKTSAGLIMCYMAAIPFFKNTVLGNALYTILLFGGFAVAQRYWPVLRSRDTVQPARV